MSTISEKLAYQRDNTEFSADAMECIAVYGALMDMEDGHVWETEWRVLVKPFIIRKGSRWDNNIVGYRLTKIGKVFLKGLER